MSIVQSSSDTVSLPPLDFEDPALTPKIAGRHAARMGLEEGSAEGREFYRLGSNRFAEHAPFAMSYAASHLKMGFADDGLIAILRAHGIGMTLQKILRDLLAMNVPVESLLRLEAPAKRSGAADTLRPMFSQIVEEHFPALVGPDGRVAGETLTRLRTISGEDAGLTIAALVASGQSDAALKILLDIPIEPRATIGNIHTVSSRLAKALARLVQSGWMADFCAQLAALDLDAITADVPAALIIGSTLYIGGHPAALPLLNRCTAGKGEIVALRDRSISEWLALQGISSPPESTYSWDRTAHLIGGERHGTLSIPIKPLVVGCVTNARLFKSMVVAGDSILSRDVVFHPKAAAENSMIEGTDHHTLLAFIPNDISFVGGDTILIGEHWNFWHYLTNHLGKIAFAFGKEEARDFNLLFFDTPSENNLQLLERFGFSRDKVIIRTGDTKNVYERLWVASIPYSESWMVDGVYTNASAITPEIFSAVREVVQSGVHTLGKRKIYLTRRDAIHRRVENEAEVCAFLEGYGFEVAEMSTLSVDEQCELVRDAQIIVGVYGAQLTTAFFAPPGCHVVELCFDRLLGHVHYEVPATALGIVYSKLCCETIGPGGPTGTHAHPSLLVPMDVLKNAIEPVVGPK